MRSPRPHAGKRRPPSACAMPLTDPEPSLSWNCRTPASFPRRTTVVWAALNDPAVLKDCLPGCESLEPDGEHAWRVVMAARVGPVSARFNGRMTMTDIEAPDALHAAVRRAGRRRGIRARRGARDAQPPGRRRHGDDVRREGAGRRQARADRLAARRWRRGEDGRRFLRALRRRVRAGPAGRALAAADVVPADDTAAPIAPPAGRRGSATRRSWRSPSC